VSSTAPEPSDREIGVVGLAVAALAVSAVLVLFRDQLFPTNAALVLVLAVLAAAIAGGRVGGALSAVLAASASTFSSLAPTTRSPSTVVMTSRRRSCYSSSDSSWVRS
jgi:K+-sensing histidine kinase KdpD